MLFLVVGGVLSASAWNDMYLICGENNGWSISDNTANFIFTKLSDTERKIIVPGSYVNSGKWYFRFREKDSDTWYNICPDGDSDVDVTNTTATTATGHKDNPKAFFVGKNSAAKWVVITIQWNTNKWNVSGSYITESCQVSFINPDGWSKVNAYAYKTESTINVDYMGAWPGTEMTEEAGMYIVDVPVDSKIIFTDGEGNQYPSTGGFDAVDNGVYDASGLKENVPASVSSLGYATFSSAYPLDFTSVSDVTAYRVSEASAGVVKMEKVTGAVPAGYGLLLKSDGAVNTYIPTTVCTTSPGTNMLVASVTDTPLTGGVKDPYRYILAADGGEVGFYYVNTDRTSGAGKAYLESTSNLTPASARVAMVFNDESETTGIKELKSVKADGIFNLRGQRVMNAQKGLYIVNGKKMLMK